MINYQKIIKNIENQLRDSIGNKTALIGISGGIDSAVTAALCIRALGKKHVLGVILPYKGQSVEDSRLIINNLGINSKEINIEQIVNQYDFINLDKISKGNIMARTRMTVLYSFANQLGGMVIGTSNKSEIEIGYFTKYGDGGVDVEPIGDLYKTEVFEIANKLKIPQKIINKKPSAGLWENQTDEGELDMTYSELDDVLRGKIKQGRVYEEVNKLLKNADHKKKMPLVFKVR